MPEKPQKASHMVTKNEFPWTGREEYVSPAVRLIVLSMDSICSPQTGGNEDVGYDDWWVE